MKRFLVLACALFLGLAPPVRAQQLEGVLDRFATAWARGNVEELASLVSRGGVTIDVGVGPIGPLGERQAAAVLRRLFDERETTVARARLAQMVGGVPARAFGEILWLARSRGTTESEGVTVFLALVREKNGWRINQIRVMR